MCKQDMLVLLLCCMMKIAEFSSLSGKPAVADQRERIRTRRTRKRAQYFRGKAMSAEVVGGNGGGRISNAAITPDSDCNSNHHPGSNGCLSNTSSQDIDFIQDNSDYQWFLDYNYRDGSTNHHTSILSLSEAYDANDVGYYDALAKDMDANLAEADIESFRTEDIHALLTTLPAMCSDPLSQDTRQGESFASVSGSMMANLDFDSSISPHSSSHGGDSANSTSMSICKSELLFSPVKEMPVPGPNFSVDSLDCELMTEHDIMLTCQANKDNYTIAFEGSTTMYSEDNDDNAALVNDSTTTVSKTTDSGGWMSDPKTQISKYQPQQQQNSMAQSDSGGFTTWSKLKKLSCDNQLRRHPSGNNNTTSSGETVAGGASVGYVGTEDNALKSQSMPNLYKQKLRGLLAQSYLKNQNMINSLIDPSVVKRRSVKVFDIQLQSNSVSGGSLVSEMATSADGVSTSSESHRQNHQQNFNLVKLFMKQKSLSAEGMSTGMDQSSISENWPSNTSHDESSEGRINQTQTDARSTLFEDSLFVDAKQNDSASRMHDLIIEEQEEDSRSESIEQLSESISKLDSTADSYENQKSTNVNNNNNSFENKDSKLNATSKQRRLKVHSTQTRRTNNSASSTASSNASSASSFSDRNKQHSSKSSNATQVPVHLINRSMQTSFYVDKSLLNAPYKLNCHSAKETPKIVHTSFLEKLAGDILPPTEKPVYVVYPNYVLPDLDFLNRKQDELDKVVLVPHTGPTKTPSVKRRPYSCNDIETLKQKGFSHINDWDSLAFLLPKEYRQILADIPEIAQKINTESIERPSFCMSPIPTRKTPRPASYAGEVVDNTTTNHSSSSSTATQPSSGYRGSSTTLSDSQNSPALGVTTNNTAFNPLFVYRYDSVTSSEASLKTSDSRPITTMAPPLPKRSISLSQENQMIPLKGDLIPPRPPLPKGILRKTLKMRKNLGQRHSMFDVTEDELLEEFALNKRFSLPDQTCIRRHKRLSETEDEGVDAGTSSSSLDELETQVRKIPGGIGHHHHHKTDSLLSMVNVNEFEQLQDYLKISGISLSDSEELDEEGIMQLRSCISKFVVLKLNEQSGDQLGGKKTVSFASKNIELKPPNNSPNASGFAHHQKHYHHQSATNLTELPIREESETNLEIPYQTVTTKRQTYDLNQKRLLIGAVPEGVEKLIHNFAPATNQNELVALGNSSCNPNCAKIALTQLCPSIYAILSDGLKSNLETSFGPISNSVWQVVEASAQQGPLTKALNELVMRINGEDVITEGLVKFNAFILGLLNVRSLDAWISYLRTRESVLKKHYNSDSLLLLAHTGGTTVRGLLDTLVSALEPLALLPFQMDLLFEYRQLHQSLNRMDSYHQPLSPTKLARSPTKQWNFVKFGQSLQTNSAHSNSDTEDISIATTVKHLSPEHTSEPTLPDLLNSSSPPTPVLRSERIRPRSCVEVKPNFRVGDDVASTARKRWSGISLSSKLYQAYDRLASEDAEEEYTDSLENCPNRIVKECAKQDDVRNSGSSNENVPHLPEDYEPQSLDSNVSNDEKPLNGKRFRRLQQKWEMLSGKEVGSSNSTPSSPVHKSKIPIPVVSPVQPSGIPVPIVSPTSKTSITGKKVISPSSGGIKKSATVGSVVRPPSYGNATTKAGAARKNAQNSRTSRVDQLVETAANNKHMTRPSSLPYKPVSMQNKTNKPTPSRRAASTSLNRKPVSLQSQNSKIVRTLSHRLPSESGHLSYNEGEVLKVILEVDEKWLLCCRGTQKGLVPRSAVIAETCRF